MDWSTDSENYSSASSEDLKKYEQTFQKELAQMDNTPSKDGPSIPGSPKNTAKVAPQIQVENQTTLNHTEGGPPPYALNTVTQATAPLYDGQAQLDDTSPLLIDNEYIETCCKPGNLVRWIFGIIFLGVPFLLHFFQTGTNYFNLGLPVSWIIGIIFIYSAIIVRDARCCICCKPCCCCAGNCGQEETLDNTKPETQNGLETGTEKIPTIEKSGKRGKRPFWHAIFEIFIFTLLLAFNVVNELTVLEQPLAIITTTVTSLETFSTGFNQGLIVSSNVVQPTYDLLHGLAFNATGNCPRFENVQIPYLTEIDAAFKDKNCSLDKIIVLFLIELILIIIYSCYCCRKHQASVAPADLEAQLVDGADDKND